MILHLIKRGYSNNVFAPYVTQKSPTPSEILKLSTFMNEKNGQLWGES